jgi:hypothetical protein
MILLQSVMQTHKILVIVLSLLPDIVFCINQGIVIGVPLSSNIPSQEIPLPYFLENFTIQLAEFINV